MPRVSRQMPGGTVFQVLNRGVGKLELFDKPVVFSVFERVLADTLEILSMRVCAYCGDETVSGTVLPTMFLM